MPKYNYNIVRQAKDERDFKAPTLPVAKLPNMIDLRPLCPPVFDQGQLGSCSANAGCSANSMRLAKPELVFSRLYLYYKEREAEGTIGEDSGAQMRDICKCLQKFGVCLESTIPYDISRFTQAPTPEADTEAANYKAVSYSALNDISHIKQYLACNKKPVLMGMDVFSSFESDAVARTGIVPMPRSGEENLGGHAVLIVGYRDTKPINRLFSSILGRPSAGCFIVRNSWGPEWGDHGYFYLPYEFFAKGFAFDFWTIS